MNTSTGLLNYMQAHLVIFYAPPFMGLSLVSSKIHSELTGESLAASTEDPEPNKP